MTESRRLRICIKENRLVSGPILWWKTDVNKPGSHFKQQNTSQRHRTRKISHLLPLSVQIWGAEEFRALVSATYKFTQAINSQLFFFFFLQLKAGLCGGRPSEAGTP